MTLADLAAILGLAVLAMLYVGFRLGEKGGCPNCHGPGGSCGTPSRACSREEGSLADTDPAPPMSEAESEGERDVPRTRRTGR